MIYHRSEHLNTIPRIRRAEQQAKHLVDQPDNSSARGGQGGLDDLPPLSGGTRYVACVQRVAHQLGQIPLLRGSARFAQRFGPARGPLKKVTSRDPREIPAGEDVINTIWVSACLETAATDAPTVVTIPEVFRAGHAGPSTPLSLPRVNALCSLPKEPF